MTSTTPTHRPNPNCRKCGGTGYISSLARVDGGRCWARGCVTTAHYTPEQLDQIAADDAAYLAENPIMTLAERSAARKVRRAEARAAALCNLAVALGWVAA